jgi:hypothetical protein
MTTLKQYFQKSYVALQIINPFYLFLPKNSMFSRIRYGQQKKDHGDGCMHNMVARKSLIQVHKKIVQMEKLKHGELYIYNTSSNYVIMKLLHPKNKNSSIDLVCCLKVEKEFE